MVSSWFCPSWDQAWKDIAIEGGKHEGFDILYVSYMEVTAVPPKTFVSSHVFRPVRGLWFLSGYILSRKGAEKLLLFTTLSRGRSIFGSTISSAC